MTWRWHNIRSYRASIGGARFYGLIQMETQDGFTVVLSFRKEPGTQGSAPAGHNAFWGTLEFQQFGAMIDLLRNEGPHRFGYDDRNNDEFQVATGNEPPGEGDGVLARP